MNDIRLAQNEDIPRQKAIWKLCFGDSDDYIDFFYTHRYKAKDTMVLLVEGEIVSMLTMLPIQIRTAEGRFFQSTMLYAIATHPDFQHRGLANRLMDHTHQFVHGSGGYFSVLVPSNKQLFDFYRQQGYRENFYLVQRSFFRENVESMDGGAMRAGNVTRISHLDYNQRRNNQLRGRLHVAYSDEDVLYQKQLSQHFGGDLLGLTVDEIQGCAAIEKLNADQVFVRELLIPEPLIPAAVQLLVQSWPAREYIVRHPGLLEKASDPSMRSFGMIRLIRATGVEVTPDDLGYLGLAFD